MKLFKTAALLLLVCLTLTSCATIVHGTHQPIGISSNPTNAAIWVDRYFVGYTPLILEMSRKDNHYVRMELEGYQPYEVTFTRNLSGWAFGNIVFGSFIGLAVDAISGGLYKLTPEQIQAEFYAQNWGSGGSYIGVVLQPDPAWEKIGQLAQNYK